MATSSHTELIESYFDHHAQSWLDFYRDAATPNGLVLMDRRDIALGFLAAELSVGGRILDAGCGAGVVAVELAEQGFEVHAVDLSGTMIGLCRHSFEERGIDLSRHRFVQGDITDPTLETGGYDGVVALGFLQYQEDEERSLTRLAEFLRPEGVLVISGPSKRRLTDVFGLRSAYRHWRDRRKPGGGNPERELLRRISPHTYSKARFRALLGTVGLELAGCLRHGYTNLAGRSARADVAVHRTLSSLARILPIDRWANDVVVLGRKRS